MHKRTEATVKDRQGKTFKVTKGAPQVIIKMCNLDEKTSNKTKEAVDELAAKGYRSLAMASLEEAVKCFILNLLYQYFLHFWVFRNDQCGFEHDSGG